MKNRRNLIADDHDAEPEIFGCEGKSRESIRLRCIILCVCFVRDLYSDFDRINVHRLTAFVKDVLSVPPPHPPQLLILSATKVTPLSLIENIIKFSSRLFVL